MSHGAAARGCEATKHGRKGVLFENRPLKDCMRFWIMVCGVGPCTGCGLGPAALAISTTGHATSMYAPPAVRLTHFVGGEYQVGRRK